MVKSKNKIKKKKKKEKISKYVNNKTQIKNFNGEKSKNNIQKEKELKFNNYNYKNDIKEIKRRYEHEIKLRKTKYIINKNHIINKYKIIDCKEKLKNEFKIKELVNNYNNSINNLLNDKQIGNLMNIIKLMNIIHKTYNICNNNYY